MKLSFKLKKPSSFVLDYLTDTEKFVSVHPVISKMDKTGINTYLVHETLKLGSIPISFTYPVSIESNFIEKKVKMKATVFKITKIEINFELISKQDVTLVEEEIHFKSPLPIKFIMKGIFKKQHTQLFNNIQLK